MYNREAMTMALEALRASQVRDANFSTDLAITTLREALAQPQDNLNCKSVQARLATSWGYVKEQPQGEWVDLTDDELDEVWFDNSDTTYLESLHAVIAKFKSKNTPPVVPQGEPVACWCRTCRPITLDDMRFVVCPDCGNKRCPKANDHRHDCTNSNEPGQKGSAYEYTTPPSVEAMRIETLEKAAKVCENIALVPHGGGFRPATTIDCAAAIRSMK